MLRLYNSLTKKKEPFVPIKPKKASMYVCGITPYDTTHLGHAFTYISFDILVRVLKHAGYKVNYAQNVTDINDRDKDILQRAKELNVAWQDLAEFWTRKFLDDMKKLNWIKPTNYLKVSENIDSMIRIIESLLSKKIAYRIGSSVYFDVSKAGNFGKLSKLTRMQMLKISKDFDEDTDNPGKDDPLDFTLWRASSVNQPVHIPSFESPFGPGRPGWHIECSSMSMSTLGEQIDIHGGGIDLIYPHHEAEIAQSEGATLKIPFVKYWMHTAPVSYKGKKMSKSLGNLIMVSNLFKKHSPTAIRWYLISHHYRKPWEFSYKDLARSNDEFLEITKYIDSQKFNTESDDDDTFDKFIAALSDDLDTPSALKIMQKAVGEKAPAVVLKKCFSLLGFCI